MHPILRLLETLGIDAEHGDAQALLAGQPPAVVAAWNTRDAAALARLLGGRATMACSIYAPEEDVPADEPAQPDEAPDEGEPRAA